MTSILDQFATPHTLDPIAGFFICDMDVVGSVTYLGYCAASGQWLIKKFDTSAGSVRYVTGASSYASAWSSRTTQTYTLPGP